MLVVVYRRLGKAYRSHLQKPAVHENGTDRLCRNVGEKLPTYAELHENLNRLDICLESQMKTTNKRRIPSLWKAESY
jgi:hypothetical protein